MEEVFRLSRYVIKCSAMTDIGRIHTLTPIGNAILIAQVALSPNALKQGSKDPFQDEMQRRRLWACYLMASYSSDTYLQRWTFQLVKNLGLPCREEDFNPDMARREASPTAETQNSGLAGELIRIICLWQVDPKALRYDLANSALTMCRNQTCELIQKKPRNMQSYLVAVQELDLAVSKWHGGLPASFQTLNQNLPDDLAVSPTLYLLHFFYHQCMCSLHASVVPLFCWGGFTNDANPLAQQLSAQTAFEHSRSISSLASSILAGAFPASRGNSFLGYACYCACAVIIPFLRCTNVAVRARAHQDVLANLTLIQELGTYWKFTKLLVTTPHSASKIIIRNSGLTNCTRARIFKPYTTCIPNLPIALKMNLSI